MQFDGPLHHPARILLFLICCTAWGCPVAPPNPPPAPAHSEEVQEPAPATPPEPDRPPSPEIPEAGKKETEPLAPIQEPAPRSSPEMSPPAGEGSSAQGQNMPLAERTAALGKANGLLTTARSQQKAGNDAEAFLNLREAWDLVQGNKDPAFQQLAGEIRDEMVTVALEISESKKSPPSKFRTLILK